ncbi:MAG TPA: hypothetical protein VNP98_15560 [Chthoniobacterales bacterium]|nr:hypothetical protein [Chthoniobacterales bacterium]
MKWLSAGLTFVNVSTVCGLLMGIAGHGLNKTVALAAVLLGLVAALLAFWGTYHTPLQEVTPNTTPPAANIPVLRKYRSIWLSLVVGVFVIATLNAIISGRWSIWLWLMFPIFVISSLIIPAPQKYRSIWFWLVVAVFAIFAIRSFCNVLFIDGNELKIQSPNNLGDLSLHLAYINNFASGVALWPDNPIYVFSKLRYPAGIDLFNALLVCLGTDVIRGLVWTGLLASAALCYALFRWGGTFTIAGFLFNGGVAGFQFFKAYQWLDYQGVPFIGWKSLALAMLVTQRGLLYALPVGLLLLYHWRAKFFPRTEASGAAAPARPPLPFWVELSLYATMPLFHVHTFMALSVVLAFLFLFLLPNVRARKQLIWLAGAAFLPATFFVWLVTDHFGAGSVMQWNPGWVQNNGDFARPLAAFASPGGAAAAPATGFLGMLKHVLQFWFINFGITIPLILALLSIVGVQAWRQREEPAPLKVYLVAFLGALALVIVALASLFAHFSFGASLFVTLAVIPPVALAALVLPLTILLQRDWRQKVPVTTPLAFVIPAVALFVFACLVKTAPWEWDNIKLIIWAYLLVLPFLWSEVISRWVFPIRAVVCVALFGSGFITLFGGLAAGRTGFGLANRAELDAIGVAVRSLPVEARFAAFPVYNHHLLLQGRKVVLGYPGHVWTQGFQYGEESAKLTALMQGAPDWKEKARALRTRYMFWGREEKANYAQSKRPWEQEAKLVATGVWGAIYDLESPQAPPLVPASPPVTPIPLLTPSPQATPSPQGSPRQ